MSGKLGEFARETGWTTRYDNFSGEVVKYLRGGVHSLKNCLCTSQYTQAK